MLKMFQGLQYEAYIYGIDRQAGFLILGIDNLALDSGLFNVSFLVQEKLLGPHTRAILDMSQLLAYTSEINSDSTGGDTQVKSSLSTDRSPELRSLSTLTSGYARKMLFPEKSDGILQTTLSKGMFNHRWFDMELNYEQQVGDSPHITEECSC